MRQRHESRVAYAVYYGGELVEIRQNRLAALVSQLFLKADVRIF